MGWKQGGRLGAMFSGLERSAAGWVQWVQGLFGGRAPGPFKWMGRGV